MSDPRRDALSDMARNRGLKLVRARVRTPGKPRFGMAGLTDRSGKPVFGMDSGGPTATPERVEDYLRRLEAEDWGASLKDSRQKKKKRASALGSAPARKEAAAAPAPRPASKSDAKAGPNARPKVERKPKPRVRKAMLADAPRLVALIRELGVDIQEKQVRDNLAALSRAGDTPLVATRGKEVVGLCGVARRVAVHRQAPLGRITILVVTKQAQGEGIGRMLVEAAEDWMRKRCCYLVEVTSSDRLAEAHAFYRHMGFERTSIRFAKQL